MSYNIQEAVEDWVLSLSQNEVDKCLSQLELKRQGTLFRNLDRLNKWVLGIYAPQDFQPSARLDDAIARRKRLREDLLRRLVTEEDGNFVETSKWEIHPLEVVMKSEQILEILQKTTAEAALDTTQHPDATADGEDNNEPQQLELRLEETRKEDTAQHQQRERRNSAERDNDAQQTPPGEMLRLLAADGPEFCVPREVGSLLAELISKVKSLEDIVLNQQRHAASSTHIAEHRTGHNVQFEDTYTVHNADEWTGLPPTPPPARRAGQTDLRGVNPAWVGGDRRSSARGPAGRTIQRQARRVYSRGRACPTR